MRHYAWGDGRSIPNIVRIPPDGNTWAELWLGTHPAAPSAVRTATGIRPLRDVAGALPYLMKILGVGQPLSLQAHPSAEQALAGYARERTAGVQQPLYSDPNAKPELVCAITPFEMLYGLVDPSAAMPLLDSLGPAGQQLGRLVSEHGTADAVELVLTEGFPELAALVEECRAHRGAYQAHAGWIAALAAEYPNDRALAVAPLMNYHVLRPGDAIYVQAGVLHAYLRGAAVEIMGSSDNVLRGGFTAKPVDPIALVGIMDRHTGAPVRTETHVPSPGQVTYDSPGAPFQLWRIDLDGAMEVSASYGPELVLCIAGDAGAFEQGQAMYVAPGETYSLAGRATLFRATPAVGP